MDLVPNEASLLQIKEFEELEDSLTKILLLIAVMKDQGLVDDKECLRFKEFLMVC